jgi:hypothetical protein
MAPIVRAPEALNRKFYSAYDPFFIFNKAKLLMFVSESWNDFASFATSHEVEIGRDGQKTCQGLRAHIRFSEFHQFEACFSLMLAHFQPQPHWVYLTTYKTKDLLDAARAFVEGNVLAASGGLASTPEAFLNAAIYSSRPLVDLEASEKWIENLDTINWMLRMIAERYVRAAAFGGEYNAYKHGVRVLTGTSEIRVGSEPTPEAMMTLAASSDSVTFLELEARPEAPDAKQVFEVLRHFNPVESFKFIEFMALLSENMKRSRLATIEGKSQVKLHQFVGVDRQAVRSLGNRFEFRVTA